jgi:hypothetical protein
MVAQSGGRLRVIRAPDAEAPPAPGGFAFHPSAGALVAQIDRALSALLGTPKHEAILRAYGLSLGDISMGDPAPGDFGPN